jgi:acid phosphatase type 7
MVVRWQTGTSTVGKLFYGTTFSSFPFTIKEEGDEKTDHEVKISGLRPDTKYYYSIEDSTKGKNDQYFVTPPATGTIIPVRIWVISDFGQTNSEDNERRLETVAQWKSFNNNKYHAGIVLSLGDQTEDDETYQIQDNYFNQLENVLKNSPLYTTIGNHDTHDSLTNYLKTFSLPANAEAGGIASFTEKYYSFDYSNIHVVVLCTEIEDSISYGKQIEWLKHDLDENRKEWLIACMHQPFHSGGYHPTNDNTTSQKRREDWLTVLEDNGVDLILQGHNHVYERSYMIDNLIGKSTEIIEANKIDTTLGRVYFHGPYHKPSGNKPHKGTIFVSCPGGGVSNSSIYYPVTYSIFPVVFAGEDYEGSVVIDVNRNQMDVRFICDEKNEQGSHIWDNFTILKGN